jgi:hypothetical protein
VSDTDAFATIRRARSLRERQPDAPASTVLVALVLATYANGRTGTNIRPGLELVADLTGVTLRQVRRHVAWLEERGELRRDKEGHRGSAACFTYLGGKEVAHDHLYEKGGHPRQERQSPMTPLQPNQPNPSGPSRPSGGGEQSVAPVKNWPACAWEGCGRPGTVENFEDTWCEPHAAEMYDRVVRRRD